MNFSPNLDEREGEVSGTMSWAHLPDMNTALVCLAGEGNHSGGTGHPVEDDVRTHLTLSPCSSIWWGSWQFWWWASWEIGCQWHWFCSC